LRGLLLREGGEEREKGVDERGGRRREGRGGKGRGREEKGGLSGNVAEETFCLKSAPGHC